MTKTAKQACMYQVEWCEGRDGDRMCMGCYVDKAVFAYKRNTLDKELIAV